MPRRIVTVAMMRPGDKLESYRMLARALERIASICHGRSPIVGDGPCRHEVVRGIRAARSRRASNGWASGSRPTCRDSMAAARIYAWPGYGEAYGLAYLEAQAAGLPVVAQDMRRRARRRAQWRDRHPDACRRHGRLCRRASRRLLGDDRAAALDVAGGAALRARGAVASTSRRPRLATILRGVGEGARWLTTRPGSRSTAELERWQRCRPRRRSLAARRRCRRADRRARPPARPRPAGMRSRLTAGGHPGACRRARLPARLAGEPGCYGRGAWLGAREPRAGRREEAGARAASAGRRSCLAELARAQGRHRRRCSPAKRAAGAGAALEPHRRCPAAVLARNSALRRFRSTAAKPAPLRVVNTHVDIIDWHGGRGGKDHGRAGRCELVGGTAVGGCDAGSREPVGILTHHLVHDETAWLFLERLFEATAGNPACRWAIDRRPIDRDHA